MCCGHGNSKRDLIIVFLDIVQIGTQAAVPMTKRIFPSTRQISLANKELILALAELFQVLREISLALGKRLLTPRKLSLWTLNKHSGNSPDT